MGSHLFGRFNADAAEGFAWFMLPRAASWFLTGFVLLSRSSAMVPRVFGTGRFGDFVRRGGELWEMESGAGSVYFWLEVSVDTELFLFVSFGLKSFLSLTRAEV